MRDSSWLTMTSTVDGSSSVVPSDVVDVVHGGEVADEDDEDAAASNRVYPPSYPSNTVVVVVAVLDYYCSHQDGSADLSP